MNPSPIDLTTLEAVKNYPGGKVASASDDDLIQAAITAFSQWLVNWTGREALNGVGTFTEVYDGNGGDRLFVRNSPVISIISLSINGATVQLSTGYGVAGAFVDQTKRSVTIRDGSTGTFSITQYPSNFAPFVFWKGRGNVQITYTAGYVAAAVNEQQTIQNQTVSLVNPGWFADQGVRYYPSLTPLVAVASNPAVGQYAVVNGLYVFNAADNAATIVVSYQYGFTPPDLEFAVRQAVYLNYKRKDNRDVKSKSISTGGGGSANTSYQDWKYPPEVGGVFQNYRRYTP